MSLEAALEEERLSVIKLLEERSQREAAASKPRSRSTPAPHPVANDTLASASEPVVVVPGGDSVGSPPASSRTGIVRKQRRPVSLLLNDEPLDEERARPSSGSADHRRSASAHGVRSTHDTSDPFSPKSGEFFYSSESLRPSMRKLSLSPTRAGGARHSRTPSPTGDRFEDLDEEEEDDGIASYLKDPFRRLSDNDLAKMGSIYSSEDKRLVKDSTAGDEEDELTDEEEEDDDDEAEDGTSSGEEEAGNDDETGARATKRKSKKKQPLSESPSNVQKLKYKSLLDIDLLPGQAPPPSMAEYAAYKRRIIHPNTAFDATLTDTPYTADTEEALDARRAASLSLDISPVHSNKANKRMIRSIRRGDLPSLSDPSTPPQKTYIVSTDLSPEATHALEWTLGTVLRDGNILYVVCGFEDDGAESPSAIESERLDAIEKMTSAVVKLLRKTRLQVYVFLEVVHCRSPKVMLTDLVDLVKPTLVILGSRGRSALKGVLLGSFSNYVVERSSVPVMVARRKLHKSKNKGLNVRLANNLRAQAGTHLSQATVD